MLTLAKKKKKKRDGVSILNTGQTTEQNKLSEIKVAIM